MPYMTCNGRTVSRHSSTKEIGQFKKDEAQAYQSQQVAKQKAHTICLTDPMCAMKLNKQQSDNIVGGFLFTILIIVLLVGIWKTESK